MFVDVEAVKKKVQELENQLFIYMGNIENNLESFRKQIEVLDEETVRQINRALAEYRECYNELRMSHEDVSDLKHIQIDTEDQPLIHNWYNLQKEYGEKLNLTKPLSLKNAVMFAGIEFVGKEHDPLCDASNTATLLRILRDPKLCDIALGHVIEALTPKPAGATLGELFNFAEFNISA